MPLSTILVLITGLLFSLVAVPQAQELGACCITTGECLELTLFDCLLTPESFTWAAGEPCDPNPCPNTPYMACCLPSGECIDVVYPSECDDLGGEWFGHWVKCWEGDPCTNPPGACCFENGACVVLMEDFCLEVPEATEWMPIQTCDPNPCEPVPTREDTWGKVKIEFDTLYGQGD